MASELTVFIVDDDASVRDALALLLGIQGFRIAVFSSAESFLAAWRREWNGCLLTDIRMPGMDGLALQQELADRDCRIPVIIITGHGDVELARQAFRAKAYDFLEKPFDDVKLVNAIEGAFVEASALLAHSQRNATLARSLASLTPREREVMELVVRGKHNREIGPALGISARTVEVHKARLMGKLGVDNVADLVRISMM
jgi:RNA polymerase sigma factor (sigma-70 family)